MQDGFASFTTKMFCTEGNENKIDAQSKTVIMYSNTIIDGGLKGFVQSVHFDLKPWLVSWLFAEHFMVDYLNLFKRFDFNVFQ